MIDIASVAFNAVLGLICCGFAWCSWGVFRLKKTSAERQALIDFLFAQPDWEDLLRHFDSVPFNDHARANERLRDPKALYHPDLHPAFEWAQA